MNNFITNNWLVKLICLIIAILFWAYIASQGAKVEEIPGGVNLEMKNVSEGLVAITEIDSISVTVAAKRNIWSKISSDSIKASIDLRDLTIGTHDVEVEINTNLDDIEIVNYTPKKVLVRLDTKVVKTVPVSVKIEGEAAEGKSPGLPTPEPDKVEVIGAKSIIDKILEAYAVVKLNNETEDVKRKVKLIALDSNNEIIKGVNFNPSEISVNIPIVKSETSKTVGIKTIFQGNTAEGYWISSINTNPSNVTITGQSNILKNINFIETKPIDINGISYDYTKEIDLNIPSGVTVLDKISKIIVDLKISNASSSKVISPEISYNNLSSNLKVRSISDVSLGISGTINELGAINTNQVILNLNLENYKNPGSYLMDINKDMVDAPESIGVNYIFPSSIEIVLESK